MRRISREDDKSASWQESKGTLGTVSVAHEGDMENKKAGVVNGEEEFRNSFFFVDDW